MARYKKAYRPLTGMSLIEFQAKYGTEEACEQALYRHKWPKGYICPKCGNKTYYKTISRRHSLLECQSCGHQESPINGTAFENSKLPLVKIFLACFFLAETKSSVSAVLLAQYISISVKTARNLLRKLRTIMIEADSHYKLSGNIVIDEGFFGAPKSGKRGRGSGKIKALFAVQYQPYKGHNIPMFLSVVKIPDFTGSTFKAFADEKITSGSVLLSDGFPTYNSLSKKYTVISTTDAPDDETSPLKLVHLFISNAKAMFQGTFHGLGAKRVQGYFSEFTYRFNRRDSKTPVVEHLLRSCVREGYTSVPALCI